MIVSQRKSLTQFIISIFKEIDGGVSPYDPNYTFHCNLYNNVVRGFVNFEAINDFPYITIEAGPERYRYHTIGNTEGSLELMVRCYLRDGDRTILRQQVDNLIEDIDHIIYKMPTTISNLHTVHITSVDSDQGLLDDYAILEVKLLLRYELGII